MAQNFPFAIRYRDLRNYWAIFLLLLFLLCVVSSTSADDSLENDVYKREAKISDSQKSETDKDSKNTQDSGDTPDPTTKSIQKTENVAKVNETNKKESNNCTDSKTCPTKNDESGIKYIFQKMSDNSAMLFRTMMVLLGVTSIVIIYFVVKAVRLRRRQSKSRKYGVITRGSENNALEMEPLGDGNDEDDDYTVFELNGRRK